MYSLNSFLVSVYSDAMHFGVFNAYSRFCINTWFNLNKNKRSTKTWKSQLTVLNDLPDVRRQKKSFKTFSAVWEVLHYLIDFYIKMNPFFSDAYCIYRMIVPRYFVFVPRVCAYSLIYLSCVSSQKSRLKMNKKVNVKN